MPDGSIYDAIVHDHVAQMGSDEIFVAATHLARREKRLEIKGMNALARRTFRFSILHLSLLFAALLLDHYLGPWLSI